jgi:sugar phosphate isomerase/epimerase
LAGAATWICPRAQAADTFRWLGDRAAAAGTEIGMETNPPVYVTTFPTALRETEAFVVQVDHPSVEITLDLGAMEMAGVSYTLADRAPQLARRPSHVNSSRAALPRAVRGSHHNRRPCGKAHGSQPDLRRGRRAISSAYQGLTPIGLRPCRALA